MTRPFTPPTKVVREDGSRSTRVTVQRACNGCGTSLGDATDAEMERAVAGLPPEDVRDECPTCTPKPAPLDEIRAAVEELRNPTPFGLAYGLDEVLVEPLAEWLEAEAAHHEHKDERVATATTRGWEVRLSASTLPQALAVARAINGGAA